jgi:hypothetical protein
MEISASITVPVDSTQEFLNAKFDMFWKWQPVNDISNRQLHLFLFAVKRTLISRIGLCVRTKYVRFHRHLHYHHD